MTAVINGDGLITLDGTSTTQGRLRLAEDTDNGTNYIELQAPASIATTFTLTMPAADGTTGQALTTNGSGTLSFTSITGGAQGFVTQATGANVSPGSSNDSFALI